MKIKSTENILWLASWPRSGNTLLRAILWNCFGLRSGALYDERATIESPGLTDMVGCSRDADLMRSQGVIPCKTHALDVDGHRAIYVIRDGREACVSYWHYTQDISGNRDCTLEDIITGRLEGFPDWSSHVNAWAPKMRAGTLLVRFEDMRHNLRIVLQALAEFLAMDVVTKEMPTFDHFRVMNPDFFRSGSVDSWRTEMTDDDLAVFWDIHGKAMGRYGYKNGVDHGHHGASRIVSS